MPDFLGPFRLSRRISCSAAIRGSSCHGHHVRRPHAGTTFIANAFTASERLTHVLTRYTRNINTYDGMNIKYGHILSRLHRHLPLASAGIPLSKDEIPIKIRVELQTLIIKKEKLEVLEATIPGTK